MKLDIFNETRHVSIYANFMEFLKYIFMLHDFITVSGILNHQNTENFINAENMHSCDVFLVI